MPIIVFSNTYLTNLIQEAWRAGATKCLSKSSCTPKEVIDIVRDTIGDSGAIPQAMPGAPPRRSADPPPWAAKTTTPFRPICGRRSLTACPPRSTSAAALQAIVKADNEMARLKQIYELYRRVHALNGNAGIAGLVPDRPHVRRV